MDAQQLARLRFLVRPDAWAAWEALVPEAARAETLALALAEYGDLRLVAAYVLDSVADKAIEDAGAAAEAAGQVVKRFKAGAEYEEEYFAPGASGLTVTAQGWAARAAQLREAVAVDLREQRQGGSMILDLETTF